MVFLFDVYERRRSRRKVRKSQIWDGGKEQDIWQIPPEASFGLMSSEPENKCAAFGLEQFLTRNLSVKAIGETWDIYVRWQAWHLAFQLPHFPGLAMSCNITIVHPRGGQWKFGKPILAIYQCPVPVTRILTVDLENLQRLPWGKVKLG